MAAPCEARGRRCGRVGIPAIYYPTWLRATPTAGPAGPVACCPGRRGPLFEEARQIKARVGSPWLLIHSHQSDASHEAQAATAGERPSASARARAAPGDRMPPCAWATFRPRILKGHEFRWMTSTPSSTSRSASSPTATRKARRPATAAYRRVPTAPSPLCTGVVHGEAEGHADGREIGVQKGVQIGREVGQYRGRVTTLLAIYSAHPELASERCAAHRGTARIAHPRARSHECVCVPSRRMVSTLTRLRESLSSISLDDPLDQRTFDVIDEVRAKMRMIELWLRGSPAGRAAARTAAAGAGVSTAAAPPPVMAAGAVGARAEPEMPPTASCGGLESAGQGHGGGGRPPDLSF